MNILITGGTGFVGKYTICHLLKGNPEIKKIFILTRNPKKADKTFNKFNDKVLTIDKLQKISAVEKIKIIINLAGEPIANKRWSKKQKEILLSSRAKIIDEIDELTVKLRVKPQLLISASAVGFYGSQKTENALDEESQEINEEFTHFLCKEIEEKALKIESSLTRVCILRFGIVLGKNGGALKKMLPAFKFGLGGKIASGQQIMSWIHIHDLIYGIQFLIENEKLHGIFNFTSPNSVKNQDFSKILAKTLNRPALFNMKESLIEFLFGEMGTTLLANGQNVYPKKLLDSGFKFKYPEIEKALKNIVG